MDERAKRLGRLAFNVSLAVAIGVLAAIVLRERASEPKGDAPVPEIMTPAPAEIAIRPTATSIVLTGVEPADETPIAAPPVPEDPKPAPADPAPAPAPTPAVTPAVTPGEKLRFREIWAYLLPGEESHWSDAAPITDLGLFDFSLDATARLTGKANLKAIDRAKALGVRTHLVLASSGNRSLLHLALSPRYGARQALLAELAALPRRHPVDGVQIDIEGPRAEERADYVSFVRELRAALPEKTLLSLALPAKTRDSPAAIVYGDLAGLADRFFIMVYDLHWKGGSPGPISPLDWHDQVLAYAAKHLPADRVVIGLPFYGRIWQREEVARAVKHEGALRIAAERSAEVHRDPSRSHSFTYKTEVTAEGWFEDAASLRAKLESAKARGFARVGFWRLGQEDPKVWEILARE